MSTTFFPARANWLSLAVAGLLALVPSSLLAKDDAADQFATQAFGALPVLTAGRVQPLDSLARNSLLQLREKQTAQTNPGGKDSKTLSAIEWLMEVAMNPRVADTRPVFRIDNQEVKALLNVPMEPDAEKGIDGKHYSWSQIRGKLEGLQTEARRVGGVEHSKRSAYEQAVMRIWSGVVLYMRLENLIEPQDAANWEAELKAFQANRDAGVSAIRAQQAGKPFDQAAMERTMMDLQRFSTMSEMEPPLIVPPAQPKPNNEGWQRMGDALMQVAKGETPSPAIAFYARMATAYREGRVAEFNTALNEYRSLLSVNFTPELKKVGSEQFFNRLQPFYVAMVLYVVAGLAALAFWFEPRRLERVRQASFWLVVLALIIHTGGLIFRMVLEGRPPVTNLYSSAIFIGWGACILGLILERVWRNSIGLVVSTVIGFLTLIIAHHLSLNGDTMEMMRAVLDTNFWLATHVVVVTLGYASTFVAGFLGIIYVILNLVTRDKEYLKPTNQSLNKMVYGIVCFATLFSFVGTVLGGIWADQSWGRFWGWDPKENGALIIVIWNALILHARWGGMVKERGLMCLAIGGNIVTSWSWFGVNMLGIGLHSYGFTSAEFNWLIGSIGLNLLLILLGAWPNIDQFMRGRAEKDAPMPRGLKSGA